MKNKIIYLIILALIIVGASSFLVFNKFNKASTVQHITKQTNNTKNKSLAITVKVAIPKIPVLMYHSVTTDKYNKNELKISKSNLKAQLDYLKANKYNTISLDQLHSHMTKRTALPTKPIIITFDDGYVDNYTIAYPLLKANKQKATVFMIANCINVKNFLTSKQLVEMDKNNFKIESHTNNHDDLSKLTYTEQVTTLKTSKIVLEKLLRKKILYVSYPYGKYNKSTPEAAFDVGFNLGVSTDNGFTSVFDNYYTINRIYVNAFYSMAKFKYNLIHEMK